MAVTAKMNSMFLMTGIVFFSLISILALFKLFKVAKKAWKDSATEGFATTVKDDEKKPAPNPEELSYELLKNVMGKIRNVTRHVFDKEHFTERLSMARMTPAELARKYIADTKKQSKQ
jgi:hypothetical protein